MLNTNTQYQLGIKNQLFFKDADVCIAFNKALGITYQHHGMI